MRRSPKIDPGPRAMLIFAGWFVVLIALVDILMFGPRPFGIITLLASLAFTLFFHSL